MVLKGFFFVSISVLYSKVLTGFHVKKNSWIINSIIDSGGLATGFCIGKWVWGDEKMDIGFKKESVGMKMAISLTRLKYLLVIIYSYYLL